MKKCLRYQMRLLVRSPGFWVAMAFGVLYAVGYFVAMCYATCTWMPLPSPRRTVRILLTD